MGREMGGRFKRVGLYVYLWPIHVEVWQKTANSVKQSSFNKKINKKECGKKNTKLVNFCIVILILKMEEKCNMFAILCLFQERYKYNWNAEKICAVYGKGAVTDQTCQKWFAKLELEISCWTMPHHRLEQLKLIVIKSRH